jgi:hypothetical protein
MICFYLSFFSEVFEKLFLGNLQKVWFYSVSMKNIKIDVIGSERVQG